MPRNPSPSPTFPTDRSFSPNRGASTSSATSTPHAPEAYAMQRTPSLPRTTAPTTHPDYIAVGMGEGPTRRPFVKQQGIVLPTFWRRAASLAPLGTRGKSGRLRWVAVGALLFIAIWRFLGQGAKSTATEGKTPRTGDAYAAVRPKTTRVSPPQRKIPPLEPPSPPPPLTFPKLSSLSSPQPIDIDVFPSSHTPPRPIRPDEKFLAYSPHSGYHNQRISLENAFTLAHMTGRTLLLPPIWLGHAIPYISFDKLQRRLQMASKVGLERCKKFGEGGSEDPIPRECDGYFDWTLIHWEFLVDLGKAREMVPTRDRWNLTDAWLAEELDLAPPKKKGHSHDIFYLKDETMYQYKFYDSPEDDEPLNKFGNKVDVLKLAEDSKDYKLLHLGSLFGTSRLRTILDTNYDARTTFRQSMMFRNPLLDQITESIRDRLGGEGKYYGVHLRVGDGVFQENAEENMKGVWTTLCVTKMRISEEICEELLKASGSGAKVRRSYELPSEVILADGEASPLSKRANSRPQREGAYHHAPLPPLPVIRSRASSPLASSLSCRGELHSASHLLPFNAPLFVATDSRIPTSSPHLAVFFDSFPCTFILSDFSSVSQVNGDPVDALNKLATLRNEHDKVPLAQFLYPQLDAQIASWGRGFVGTPLSTYSRFAADVLHQVYHGWDIIERG